MSDKKIAARLYSKENIKRYKEMTAMDKKGCMCLTDKKRRTVSK